ncbi:CD209 antigen-like protein 2 isoform X2 [Siniperca chuatsi]|uniref:CD209 antigen-like protein 2 isoform X2 n=1 Tax=Siniperca chuatsi TaxID=119488 RepID=UPI001CE064F9|nr:CD209 antigen-like protein 2 isoform X2 [Siniperca chuatsi]
MPSQTSPEKLNFRQVRRRTETQSVITSTMCRFMTTPGQRAVRHRNHRTRLPRTNSKVSICLHFSQCSGQRNLLKAVAVFLGLLCLLLLAAVIILVVLQNCNTERNQLWMDNAIERDKLQRSYSEMESLNHHLTQITSQLENEKDLMKAINNNLTKERDELQTQLETTCCPDHWIKFGNSCYLISNSKKNWNDSRTFCKNEDAQLVIISSYEEQELLSSFKREAWIGLTDAQTETVWKWVNGTEVTKTYWRNGQPDNYQNSENCAEISDRYPDLSNWNDLSCSSSVHFICEKILQ